MPNSSQRIFPFDITIIISYKDDPPYTQLKRTISSILLQQNIRLQVIICRYSDKFRFLRRSCNLSNSELLIIDRPDEGIADSWNYALNYRLGAYILFLGAGDTLFSDSILCLALNLIRSRDTHGTFNPHHDLSIFYGISAFVTTNDSLTYSQPYPRPSMIRSRMIYPHASMFYDSRIFDVYLFNESFRISIDYEHTLRLRKSVDFFAIPCITTQVAFGGLSTNHFTLPRVIREDIRAKWLNQICILDGFTLNLKRIYLYFLSIFIR
jgi:hypothetical protein